MQLSRHYAKTCDLPDFGDVALTSLTQEIDPARTPDEPHRKGWEYAMTASFLRDAGVLRDDARILDVGAGSEPILFWLAQRCAEVVAVDIYGRGGFASREAQRSFLDDPPSYAPYDYPRERLVVRDMDARHLDFPDASFDAVVSLSSIEHFGDEDDIARSAREIGRVLKPGGVAFLVTEVFLRLAPLHWAPVSTAIKTLTRGSRLPTATLKRRLVDGFKPDELHSRLVAPSGLQLLQPVDIGVGSRAWENVTILHSDGRETTSTGLPYPHIVVGTFGSRWTSICVPLRKPA